MKYLDSLVGDLNNILASKVQGTKEFHGICRKAESGNEIVNYNEAGNAVSFSSDVDIFWYHNLISISGEQSQARGKKFVYLNTATLELIVYSRNRATYDYMVSRISESKDSNFISANFDSKTIHRKETGNNEFNIDHYLFSIEFTIQYLTDKCTTLTEC